MVKNMIFNKIILKNFKSHKDTTIDFDRGISIIVGENGVGKSTILEAISFALFKQFTGKKIDSLIRTTKSKSSQGTMSVTLEFESNGNDYKIFRSRNSNSKAEFSSKKGGSFIKISSGDKEVNKEIQSILEMDSDLFLNAIYIRQGEIADLVGKTPAEKKQLIGKLLGVEGLEKAWKNILPLITSYENEKAELKGRTASTLELSEELKTKEIELDDLKQKGKEIEKEFIDLKQLKKEKTAEKIKMDETKASFENLNNQLENEIENIKRVNGDVKNLHEQLEKFDEMDSEMSKLEKYTKKLPIYRDFLDSVKLIEQVTNSRKTFKEQLDSILKQKEIVKKEEPLFTEYLDLQKKINNYNERKSKLEKESEALKQLEKNKDNIVNAVQENEEKIEEFFKKTSKTLDIDFENFNDLKSKVNKLKIKIEKELTEIDENISSKSKEISKLEERIKSVEKPLKEIKEVDNQCPICKSDITEEKKNDLINTYEKTIKSNSSKINKLTREIKELESEKINIKNKLEEINFSEKEISSISPLNELIRKNNEDIKILDKKLKFKDETKDKLSEILLIINEQNKRQEKAKESHDNYIQAKGSLDALGNEHDTRSQLRELEKDIDVEVEKIKIATNRDSYLSPNINENDLKERITDLIAKDQRYNQLKGSLKQKSSVKSQLSSKIDDLDSIRSKIDNIEHNIKSLNYDKEEYDKLSFIYERTELGLEKLNNELGEIKGEGTALIKNIEDLKVRVNKNEFLKQRLENVEQYLHLLKEIRELYSKDGIQKELRNRSRPIIEKHTKEFFEKFNFNYSDLKIDEDYDISIFGPEGETSLDMVSGGERIAIALALRLGITQSMSKGNIETILLDEPTIHLDGYRRHELINLLRQMSDLPQMIIVTHDEELESASDNIIKVNKNKGISEVVLES